METGMKSVDCVHLHVPNKVTSKPAFHGLECCGIFKYWVCSWIPSLNLQAYSKLHYFILISSAGPFFSARSHVKHGTVCIRADISCCVVIDDGSCSALLSSVLNPYSWSAPTCEKLRNYADVTVWCMNYRRLCSYVKMWPLGGPSFRWENDINP